MKVKFKLKISGEIAELKTNVQTFSSDFSKRFRKGANLCNADNLWRADN
jgi:hypothetical protein